MRGGGDPWCPCVTSAFPWLVIPVPGLLWLCGYDVDAPSTSLERHERGIHTGPYGGAGVTDPVTRRRNPASPGPGSGRSSRPLPLGRPGYGRADQPYGLCWIERTRRQPCCLPAAADSSNR